MSHLFRSENYKLKVTTLILWARKISIFFTNDQNYRLENVDFSPNQFISLEFSDRQKQKIVKLSPFRLLMS